ncbi:MAG: TIM barrel protein [Paucibacter sp.]|nr:TIM barrel protein [Roseateles sp.]
MPKFAANLSFMYGEHEFMARFAAAARDGFEAVEFLFPYEHAPQLLVEQLRQHGLKQALFNAPPGNWDHGERGIAALPGREAEFRRGLLQALDYAQALDCPRIHVMAGLVPPGAEPAALMPAYLLNLRWAAEQASNQGRKICIEPINPRDMPGYLLNRQEQAWDIIRAVDHPALELQMDCYHCQIVEGDVSRKLQHAMSLGVLGHVQVAAAPSRHEPDEGELRVEHLLNLLDTLGYAGYVGCEYRPRGDTSAGLAWLRRWRDLSRATG